MDSDLKEIGSEIKRRIFWAFMPSDLIGPVSRSVFNAVDDALISIEEKKMKIAVENPSTFEDSVEKVQQDLKRVMLDRQKKYGHSNIMDFGEKGVLIRANDKIARLKNYYFGDKEKFMDETLIDSWTDLANYATIALMLISKTFERPLQENCKQTFESQEENKNGK